MMEKLFVVVNVGEISVHNFLVMVYLAESDQRFTAAGSAQREH